MYFYFNSTYIQYQFLQDLTEFFSWQAYGLRSVNKRWKKISDQVASGLEQDYKLTITEADDLLYQILEEKGYEGETFEDLINGAGKKMLPNFDDILFAHGVRNSIVYDPNYKLDSEVAKKMLSDYESAIKNLAVS